MFFISCLLSNCQLVMKRALKDDSDEDLKEFLKKSYRRTIETSTDPITGRRETRRPYKPRFAGKRSKYLTLLWPWPSIEIFLSTESSETKDLATRLGVTWNPPMTPRPSPCIPFRELYMTSFSQVFGVSDTLP